MNALVMTIPFPPILKHSMDFLSEIERMAGCNPSPTLNVGVQPAAGLGGAVANGLPTAPPAFQEGGSRVPTLAPDWRPLKNKTLSPGRMSQVSSASSAKVPWLQNKQIKIGIALLVALIVIFLLMILWRKSRNRKAEVNVVQQPSTDAIDSASDTESESASDEEEDTSGHGFLPLHLQQFLPEPRQRVKRKKRSRQSRAEER